MYNFTIPGRVTGLIRQNVQPFSSSQAGLSFRLNTRSYIKPAARNATKRQPIAIAVPAPSPSPSKGGITGRMFALIGGVGIGLFAVNQSSHKLMLDWDPLKANQSSGSDSVRGYSINQDPNDAIPFGDDGKDVPKSDVNIYNLGFGSVCGICAGIFIKKGLKFVAFLLGGGFILLQYLNTQKIIKVDWKALGRRYDSAVDSAAGKDAVQVNKPASGWRDSTAARIWNRFTHFLTADFPSRGTFLAGLILGLRLG
jgi:uncharacterized membrane protein (Fun14 family)